MSFHTDVLANLLSCHHAWWWDFIDEIPRRGGKKLGLRGRPYFSPGFGKLYGWPNDKISVRRIIHPDDQKKVLAALRRALEPQCEAISDTVRTITHVGEPKLVEIYTRRIVLPGGAPILASIHSDLTVSNDLQWINQKVLEKLQAFVFLKKWDSVRQCHVFAHINHKLAEALELSSPLDALGKDDSEYFSKADAATFQEADLRVRDADSQKFLLIQEERFRPRTKSGQIGKPMRLMTFKTPYYSPLDESHQRNRQILGIAFDVTQITDLLRAVADASEDGIFIKSRDHKYVTANTPFLKLLGVASEDAVTGKTFAQVVQNSTAQNHDPLLKSVIEAVHLEDESLFVGIRSEVTRSASTYRGEQYVVKKKLVIAGPENTPHILGTTVGLFSGDLAAMLDKLPQAVLVKRLEENAGTKAYKIAWANKKYLSMHKTSTLAKMLNRTDFELWPEEAPRFEEIDNLVVSIAEDAFQSEEWRRLSPALRWETMVAALRANGCWEYREVVTIGSTKAMLQTTKWAERLYGTWFVFVVISDVTKGDNEQRVYHDMTVHSIKSDFCPVDIAIDELSEMLKAGRADMKSVERAISCLNDASDSINWFLNHHLALLRMDVKPIRHPVKWIYDKLEAELQKAQRRSRYPLSIDMPNVDRDLLSREIPVDPTFLKVVLAEVIRNGQKSIERRCNVLKNIRRGNMSKEHARRKMDWIQLSDDYMPCLGARVHSAERHLVITIHDNGAACDCRQDASKLAEQFNMARTNPFELQNLRLGLAFCMVTIEKHNGELGYTSTSQATEFTISVPF